MAAVTDSEDFSVFGLSAVPIHVDGPFSPPDAACVIIFLRGKNTVYVYKHSEKLTWTSLQSCTLYYIIVLH